MAEGCGAQQGKGGGCGDAVLTGQAAGCDPDPLACLDGRGGQRRGQTQTSVGAACVGSEDVDQLLAQDVGDLPDAVQQARCLQA